MLYTELVQELKEYRDRNKDDLSAATSGLSVGESDVSSDSSQHPDVLTQLPHRSHGKC